MKQDNFMRGEDSVPKHNQGVVSVDKIIMSKMGEECR